MVMDGGHQEDAFTRESEIRHLNDHRERFDHEDAPHDEEQEFMPNQHRNRAQRAAKGEGFDISNEEMFG